jgi:hypothetical protein
MFENKHVTYKVLKKYILEVYEELKEKEECNSDIHVIYVPIKINGFLFSKYNGTWKNEIFINVYTMLKASDKQNIMCYFYSYATLSHEIEHIRIINALGSSSNITYSRLLAMFEQIIMNVKKKPLFLLDMVMTSNIAEKKYYTSPIEISCIKSAYESALDYMKDDMPLSNYKNIYNICDAVSFWEDNMELGYYIKDRPYNLFVYLFDNIGKCLLQDKEIYDKYPIVSQLFNSDGTVLSIDRIFDNFYDLNRKLCDKIIIHLFMYYKTDYTDIFLQRREVKEYINKLANEYCKQVIRYYQNISFGACFLQESILIDNLIVMQSNVECLINLMKIYKMEHTDGGIIPLRIY